uniref:Phosphatidic acid phosphatase type 2/haloperoxidase domain-containing protein n=1 Tax=Alexandrium andersonii TaxID=327968 RepID=A0A7S2BZB0_9DINO|mmetsp:Transcript_32130/g.73209  ORF Transcript_32130/g.73209 Transcript_32130/m.73209 type:complete len:195 (+) Transcript_32130:1-585(+)
MKFCVQRVRPRYAKQSTFYILPGEWWSFPSGHSMRAAYLAHRFSVTPSLQAAILGPAMAGSAAIPALAYAWAAMVGLSRVAKGRHSPFDVLVGLAAGVPLAELTLFVGLEAWTVGRFFAGSMECVLLGIMAAQPELRLEGFYVHAGLQALWFSFQPYNVWLPLTWGAVLALSSALFCFSYAAAYATSSRRPWLL